MQLEHYETFKQLLATGRRAAASASIKTFIESFANLEEKTVWARNFLDTEQIGHKIRHELYEQVIFPVLLAGYQQKDPWSLRWLARTVQNLHQSDALWRSVGYKTELGFLEELLSLDPDDHQLRKEVLSRHLDWFSYAAHEWPAGILYGQDGASARECEEIRATVAEARALDVENLHGEFLAEFERKLAEYMARIDGLRE